MSKFFLILRSAVTAIGLFGFFLIYFEIVPENTVFISSVSFGRYCLYIIALSLAGTASLFVASLYSPPLLYFNLSISVFILEYPHWTISCPPLSAHSSLFYLGDGATIPIAFFLSSLFSKIMLRFFVFPIKNISDDNSKKITNTIPLLPKFLPLKRGLAACVFSLPHFFLFMGLVSLSPQFLTPVHLSLFLGYCIAFLSLRLFSPAAYHYTLAGLMGGCVVIVGVCPLIPHIPVELSLLKLNYPLLYSASLGLSISLAAGTITLLKSKAELTHKATTD